LTGKTQQFPNGFTVSGWANDYSVYNGNYTNVGGGAFIKDNSGDVYFWNGSAWQFEGYVTQEACAENDFFAPCCCALTLVNSSGGGDSANFPTSGWTAQVSGSEARPNYYPGGTLTFAAR
jgi:hypothetical protein